MLKRLHLRNFTVFEDADFEFESGLNVIVGTNGTGKSHVLKMGYIKLHNLFSSTSSNGAVSPKHALGVSKEHSDHLNGIEKFERVFQISKLEELIRRDKTGADTEINSTTVFLGDKFEESLVLPINSKYALTYDSVPLVFPHKTANPVFIPAKEVLTTGWLLPLYDRREIPIDETYPDLLRLLMGPPLRHPESIQIVAKLQELIGGKVEEEGGHFYLSATEQPRMEMNLVAEGFRKFATLYKLLANGTLTPETTLFWDEPEANLNPALLKEMAAVLAMLARAGFQIILATHSLFLLKELHILSRQEQLPIKYFGLSAENGGPTQVSTADTLTALPNLVALDVEMAQSDIFLDVLNQEDASI